MSGTVASRCSPVAARPDALHAAVMLNHDVHRIYSPSELGHTTVIVHLTVHDIDSHYARAVAQGADITMELEDAFYGERRYEATDLEGHRWHFAESHEAIRARGGDVPDDPQGGKP